MWYCTVDWLFDATMSGGEALACAVCFGDPDSPMAKGVVWGVLVLVGIVSFVLAGVAGTALFWLHRSRHLPAQDRLE